MGRIARTRIQPRAVQIKTGFPQLPYRSRFATAVSKMARPNTKRLLPILLATAARALLPPRQHRISMRRAPPCQPKRRRTKAPNAAARTAPTRQTTALSASKDETVGKQGTVIVDAEAGFIDGAAGPAAAAAPQPTAMDAVTLVAVAAPPAKTKTKNDKKRQQAKSPQSLKVAAATIALAATAPVPTTLFAWHPALAALSLPLAAAAGVVVAGRAAAAKRASGADRRATLERRVKLHFVLSAAASWCLVLSTAAVFLSKAQARRPHLVSAHARAGAAALVAWFGALLAAELKVWRDGPPWRAAPRFLWSDQSHRRLGVGALLVLGGAAVTGLALTGFGGRLAAPRRRTALAAVCAGFVLEAYDRRRDFAKALGRLPRRRAAPGEAVAAIVPEPPAAH